MSQSYAEALSWVPKSRGLATTLARAFDYAASQSHKSVLLEHLLLALISDADASAVLQACRVDLNRLDSDVTNYLAGVDERLSPGDTSAPVASPELLRIVEYASAAARQSRRREVNGAIVLAAIVGDGRSPAASMLREQGLTFEEAIKALQKANAAAREPGTRPASVSAPRPRPAAPPPQAAPAAPSYPDEQAAADPHLSPQQPGPRLSHPEQHPDRDRPAAASAVNGVAGGQTTEEILAAARRRVGSGLTGGQPGAKPETQDAPRQQPERHPADDVAHQEQPEDERDDAIASQEHSAGPPPGEDRHLVPPQPQPPGRPQGPMRPHAAPQPADYSRSYPPPGFGQNAPAEDLGTQAPQPRRSDAPSRTTPPPRGAPAPEYGPTLDWPRPAPSPQDSYYRPHRPDTDDTEQVRRQPTAHPQQERFHPPPPPPPHFPGHPAAGPSRPGRAPWPEPPAPAYPQQGTYGSPQPAAARAQPELRGRAPNADEAPATQVFAGQLVENIPRTMTVGVPELVEVSIAKAELAGLAEKLQGSGAAYRHDIVVTKAMSVRLRAPEGGFWIETASPETQWIENSLGLLSDDYASWRWMVTPQRRGRARLQLIVSARTVGADGLAAETALPDQVIEVKIRANYGRTAVQWGGWIAAAVLGGIFAKFGEGLLSFGGTVLSLLGIL